MCSTRDTDQRTGHDRRLQHQGKSWNTTLFLLSFEQQRARTKRRVAIAFQYGCWRCNAADLWRGSWQVHCRIPPKHDCDGARNVPSHARRSGDRRRTMRSAAVVAKIIYSLEHSNDRLFESKKPRLVLCRMHSCIICIVASVLLPVYIEP